jgi:hypothetical protein
MLFTANIVVGLQLELRLDLSRQVEEFARHFMYLMQEPIRHTMPANHEKPDFAAGAVDCGGDAMPVLNIPVCKPRFGRVS